MNPIPPELSHFLQQAQQFAEYPDNMLLPWTYPAPSEWADWQEDYVHYSGENSGFQPAWLVFARNYFDDAFMVDSRETAQGLPVYFMYHGIGKWVPIRVFDTLTALADFLTEWQSITPGNTAALYLAERTDVHDNPFWREMYETESGREALEAELAAKYPPKTYAPDDWQRGEAVILDCGAARLKTAEFLRRKLKLSPKEALALSRQQNIVFAQGHLLHLRADLDYLSRLGAAVEFRVREEDGNS